MMDLSRQMTDKTPVMRRISRAMLLLAVAGMLLGGAGVILWLSPTPAPVRGALEELVSYPISAGRARREADRLWLDALEHRLGDEAPIGRGVVMGHVEGQPGEYMPDLEGRRFDGVEIIPRSGESEANSHATTTAGLIYGRRGLAPGVEQVHMFTTPHWLGDGFLRTGQPLPPREDEPRVWSHSWIAPEHPGTDEVLRRVDYAIDRHGTIMCVGVNNDRRSRVPALLGSAYNVIAVGSGDARSSGGYTRVHGEGRSKPDIAGPPARTSYATPVVAAAAARLLEAASAIEDEQIASRAQRPEVIKALLMAGAAKPWNWNPEPDKPLDEFLGAGVLHLDASLRMLEAGRVEPGASASVDAGRGWDHRAIEPEGDASYTFTLEEVGELSAMLVWHRGVAGQISNHPVTNEPGWATATALAEIHLELHYRAPDGREAMIAQSRSEIDNVQHVHLHPAPPGQYTLRVTRQADGHAMPWHYAIAWRAGQKLEVDKPEHDD